MQLKTVVVVDDQPSVIKALGRMLRPVRTAGTTRAHEAIELVRVEQPQLAIVDLYLPGSWGVDVVRALRAEFPTLVIGVMSAALTLKNAGESIEASASWFLEKPFDREQLGKKITTGGAPLILPPHPNDELSLELAKWRHVQGVLALANGNKSEAARMLEIKRQSLQRYLKCEPTKSTSSPDPDGDKQIEIELND